MDQRFPKTRRLRTQSDFDMVFAQDHFAADDVLVIRARRNETGHSRLGLSISRRVGNAVVRNRWKRLIREAFRKQLDQFPAGIDLVVRPRKGAVCDYAPIARSIVKLASRLNRKMPRKAGPKNAG
ncbi:MAG: ribonuclease P protein component [Planctomycetota bacterium]